MINYKIHVIIEKDWDDSSRKETAEMIPIIFKKVNEISMHEDAKLIREAVIKAVIREEV